MGGSGRRGGGGWVGVEAGGWWVKVWRLWDDSVRGATRPGKKDHAGDGSARGRLGPWGDSALGGPVGVMRLGSWAGSAREGESAQVAI